MKNLIKLSGLLIFILVLNSCSPALKVLNSWSGEEVNNLKNKNVLVITKAVDNAVRVVSEETIKKELTASNIKAKESYHMFTMLEPNKKLNEQEIESAIKKIKAAGFDAVVLTTLKDYDETEYTSQSGGYYAGGHYYGGYYGRFGLYYGNVYSTFDRGVYVPSETTTTVSKKYVIETVTYNLKPTNDKELISVITTQIEDPNNMKDIAGKYAKKVVANLLNAKK